MEDGIRILHYLAFSIGLGGGLANMLAGRLAAAAPEAARPVLGRLSAQIGRASALSLVVLWLTGVAMFVNTGWTLAAMSGAFWAKMAAVLVLTGCAAAMQTLGFRAARANRPPPAQSMARLGLLANLAALTALALAVLAFR